MSQENRKNLDVPTVCVMVLFLCVPLIGAFAPRTLAYAPGVVGLLGVLSLLMINRRFPRLSFNVLVVPGVILSLMALSSLWAIDVSASLDRLGKSSLVLLGGVLFVLYIQNAPQKACDIFVRFFPVAAALAAGLMVLEMYTDGAFYTYMNPHKTLNIDGYINLSALNRNVIIAILLSMVAIWVLTQNSRWQTNAGKAMTALLGAFILALLAKTDSQSAQMGFVFAVILAALFPYIGKKSACLIVTLIAAAGIVGMPWIAQALFKHLLPLTLDVEWLREGYAAHRLEIWDFVVRRALENPFLGYGVEATRVITDFDSAQRFHPSTEVLHPHNFAAQIWIEFGVFGAVVLSGVAAFMMRCVYRLDDRAARLALTLFVFCISVATTGYGLWQSWWIGTFALAFGLVVFAQKTQTLEDGNKL